MKIVLISKKTNHGGKIKSFAVKGIQFSLAAEALAITGPDSFVK